jgi:hypothetical protein
VYRLTVVMLPMYDPRDASRRVLAVKILLIALVTVTVAISLVRIRRRPERVSKELLPGARVDSRVLAVFERACRDCHSDQTHYPWYSYVAPISWLVEHDVAAGREHLNLSRWNEYSILRRQRCLSEIANQVEDGEMPLPLYTVIHPSARLLPADVDLVFKWTQSERVRLTRETVAGSAQRDRDGIPRRAD